MIYIYDNLKYIREQLNLSKNMFAKMLCLNVSNISRWENKKNGMDLDTANIISKKLKIPLSKLIEKDLKRESYILKKNQKIELYLSKNIKYLRKKYGYNQEEFGKIINKKDSTIGNYEKGIRNPDYNTLCIISDHFNITTDDLIKKNLEKENK